MRRMNWLLNLCGLVFMFSGLVARAVVIRKMVNALNSELEPEDRYPWTSCLWLTNSGPVFEYARKSRTDSLTRSLHFAELVMNAGFVSIIGTGLVNLVVRGVR